MGLIKRDRKYLEELQARSHSPKVTMENRQICVVFPDWEVPPGLYPKTADLLVILPPGYPEVPPDSWWFSSDITRLDGRPLDCTHLRLELLGRLWYGWSRHLTAEQWDPSTNGLQTYIALIGRDMRQTRWRDAA